MCNEQCMYCIWRRASVLGNYLLHNKYNVYNHAINDQNICCVLINYFINKRQVVQLFHHVIMFQTRSNYSGREVELGQQNKNKGQLSFGWSDIIDICFKYRWLYHAASLEFWLLSWKYIHGICKCNNIQVRTNTWHVQTCKPHVSINSAPCGTNTFVVLRYKRSFSFAMQATTVVQR